MASWSDQNGLPYILPAAMLAESAKHDEALGESMSEPLHTGVRDCEPDEHTTDPGVGAADMECVYHLHMLEDEAE